MLKKINNVSKACRYYGISRQSFYHWKRAYQKDGQDALINSKPCAYNLTIQVPKQTEELIIWGNNVYLGI